MSKPLRFGIMGTGNIAGQFAQGVAGARRSAISAVGSRTTDAADVFGERHGIANRHATYDALLADDTVDAIYLSLPNSMHHEWTIKSIEAGKHVLCEKPIASNTAEAEAMFDAAEKHGKVLVEAFMYRSHPLTHAIVQHIRDGAIGKVKLIRTSFCYRTNQIDGNVRFSPELVGGALMDIGCYCTSFARLIAEAEPDAAQCTAVIHETGVDELAAGYLRFPDGLVANFVCGMRVQTDNAALINGEEGYISVPIPWKPPVDGAEFYIDGMTPPRQDKSATTKPGRRTIKVDAGGPLYGLEADEFAATVLDGAAPAVSKSDTLGNMRVLDTLRAQAGLAY